jgi:hypothetical protein
MTRILVRSLCDERELLGGSLRTGGTGHTDAALPDAAASVTLRPAVRARLVTAIQGGRGSGPSTCRQVTWGWRPWMMTKIRVDSGQLACGRRPRFTAVACRPRRILCRRQPGQIVSSGRVTALWLRRRHIASLTARNPVPLGLCRRSRRPLAWLHGDTRATVGVYTLDGPAIRESRGWPERFTRREVLLSTGSKCCVAPMLRVRLRLQSR